MTQRIGRRDALKTLGLLSLALTSGSFTAEAQTEIPAGLGDSSPYTLLGLPYQYNALEPAISEAVLKIHYEKHHAGYVKGLNRALSKLYESRKINDYGQIRAYSRNLSFHGSGHVLHTLYWSSMSPEKNDGPSGKLRTAIGRDFGSFEAFSAHFSEAAISVEGSGWGALVFEPMSGRLLILQVEKHQDLTIWGAVPIMVCDVWEHAYYLQYQSNRGEYIDNFMKIIDWPAVGKRFDAVHKMKIDYR